jgi:hypothetical protein
VYCPTIGSSSICRIRWSVHGSPSSFTLALYTSPCILNFRVSWLCVCSLYFLCVSSHMIMVQCLLCWITRFTMFTGCIIIRLSVLPELSVFICWINLLRTAHMYSVVEVIISFKFHINLCFMYSKT